MSGISFQFSTLWIHDHTGFAGSPVDMVAAKVAGEPTFRHEYVISDSVRLIVDKMCYVAVFWGKSVFETKVPASTRAQFSKLHTAPGAREKFAEAWKAYFRANPPASKDAREGSVDKDMLDIFGLNDDDDDDPAVGGPPADRDATPPA